MAGPASGQMLAKSRNTGFRGELSLPPCAVCCVSLSLLGVWVPVAMGLPFDACDLFPARVALLGEAVKIRMGGH